MGFHSLLFLLLFYPLALQACLNPDQLQGECTNCSQQFILFQGMCLHKLEGCLVHQIGPICSYCENGYILKAGACLEVQGPFQKSLENILRFPRYETISIINTPGKIQEGQQQKEANQHFIDIYGEELQSAEKISHLKIQSKNGMYLIMHYQQRGGKLYEAIGLKKQEDKDIAQISFREVSVGFTAESAWEQSLQNGEIESRNFLKMDVTSKGYIFDFLIEEQITRISVNSNKKKVQRFTISEMAKMVIQQKYRDLSRYQKGSIKMEEIADQIIFHYDTDYSVSVTFRYFQFRVNSPVQLEVPSTVTRQSLISGRYLEDKDLNNPTYISTLQYLFEQFPQLRSYQVSDVKTQLVAGTNFLIFLTNRTDQYVFKIYSDFSDQKRILKGYHNQDLIYTSNYNYNNDKQFFYNYDQVTATLEIRLPSIDSVYWKRNAEGISYQVNYNNNQMLVLTIKKGQTTPQLSSYSIQQLNFLGLTHMLESQAKDRQFEDLLNFLLVNPENVKQYRADIPLYSLKLVIENGTYQIVIEDTNNGLEVIKNERISQMSCFEFERSDYQHQKIEVIDKFLKKKFELHHMILELVQKQIRSTSAQYLLLYTDEKKRQIQFIIKVTNQFIEIIKGKILNDGYQEIKTSPIINRQIESRERQDHSLLFIHGNSTNLQGFYSTDSSTKSILHNIVEGQSNVQVLHRRNYLIIPRGWDWDQIIVPEVNGNDFSIAEKLLALTVMEDVSQKYSSYVKNPTLKFAQRSRKSRQSDSILILIKTELGYMQISASVKAQRTVDIMNLKLTQYQDDDFSTCTEFDRKKQCLSCMAMQISYQGSCFTEIEGCLIQAANICLKCQSNYIQSGYKCFRNCQTLFL